MLLYAKQPVYHLIQHHPDYIKRLYLAKDIDKKEYSSLMKKGFEVKRIPSQAASKMVKNASHQGFIAEVKDITLTPYKQFLDMDFVVILAGVTDIGNIGSLVRSAYALGVDGIVATNVKKLPLEAITRVSTSALYELPFAIEHNIHTVLNDFKTSGFSLYGADMGGEDIRKITFPSKKVLVLGSEGEGLTSRISSKLDKIISIKMLHKFDSLNVAVAGAIMIDRMRDE